MNKRTGAHAAPRNQPGNNGHLRSGGAPLFAFPTKTFLAMLARDAHVARRNFFPFLLQTMLQPMLFVFIFGRVMVRAGMLPLAYKSLLLPGIMAISMVLTGIWAVAMPLISELQFTKEIEDRLLAPMDTSWVAIEKIVAGMIQSLVSGIVIIPTAYLILRPE